MNELWILAVRYSVLIVLWEPSPLLGPRPGHGLLKGEGGVEGILGLGLFSTVFFYEFTAINNCL